MSLPAISELPAIDPKTGVLNVVIETPQGSRVKFKYDEGTNLFLIEKKLPYGHVFPFEFGFFPSTLGGDGDPLDAIVLAEESTYPGCLVMAILLGVIEAEQREGEKTNRNDRLIVAPMNPKTRGPIFSQRTLDDELASEITQFFVSYNRMQGKEFKSLGSGGPERAMELVQEGIERAREKRDEKSRAA
jgi:inorganic pyrophosphatase